ncbi:MAG: hypothetical protein KJI70_02225 [Patescibacteria group bacterium]|nr:hypothetical protein [Patescibacteria group bacterium]
MKSKIYKRQQGIAVLFAVSILSVILTISLGVSVILVKQIKAITEIGYSAIAFYAADNGIEEVLSMTDPVDIPETSLNGSKYEVSVKDSNHPDCDAANYCIKSVGSYKGTKRAIEIKY